MTSDDMTHVNSGGRDQGRNGSLASSQSVLTKRELEVVRLMADGLTTKAIAAKLGVAFKTVATHREHILQKLHVTSAVSAVCWAIREGLIQA